MEKLPGSKEKRFAMHVDFHLVKMFIENSAGFKLEQNSFNIKWCRLSVALGLLFLEEGIGGLRKLEFCLFL